jgi:radical SAM superfamily enzyme YgiQ (UPF0313 family)
MAECVVKGEDYSGIRNLWVKKGKDVHRNPLRPLKDMEFLPFQDWSIFDKRHYYKPYCGDFRKTAFVEMARGCHYNCTYCVNSKLRQMYKGLGHFVRSRSADRTFDEICYLKDSYGIELLFFIDDNFLGMPRDVFTYFCREYKRRINLPFYIQTRSETVKEDYVKSLKEIGVSTIAIGVEHGDEDYRKEYMGRKMGNDSLQKAFDIVNKNQIRTTANIIIGMPHETEKMMGKTINLLKNLKPSSVSINFWTPYRGTVMREMAVKDGIIPENHMITKTNTCLDMPQFRADRIRHYFENLKKYVEGELFFEEP